ncbi:MAG: hypothetical protein JNL50_07480 [Phycisphaerae bacterium]|nr:hypothetical protein [Phycisphaerae bacterium]
MSTTGRTSRVEIGHEAETPRGWRYEVHVTHADGTRSEHWVTLAWVDHDHWCGGRLAPSRVVEMVLEYLLEKGTPVSFPAAFDAARARRWIPAIDQDLKCAG